MWIVKLFSRVFYGLESEGVPVSNMKKDRAWREKRNAVIRERFAGGDKQTVLCHDYGLDPSTISRIVRRKKRNKRGK